MSGGVLKPANLISAACLLLLAAARLAGANFVEPASLDYAALVGPPPAAGSVAARAELAVVLELQALRTPDLARRAGEIERETFFGFGADVVGPWFTADHLPRTAALLARVREDFNGVNRLAKARWPRRRPPYVDPRVQPCVETTDSGSYPSGHGIQASLWAALLAEVLPEHAAGFAARAAETRRMKLLSGVHFPSDVVAGQVIGEALAAEMLKSDALRRELAAVREELGQARPRP
ncbi:MAG TPA: phosphatase PAP2 family protein [Opitutaceae bacterium]|nr:phosphatase PAP2 family protein [Opitutaceae bacterium]